VALNGGWNSVAGAAVAGAWWGPKGRADPGLHGRFRACEHGRLEGGRDGFAQNPVAKSQLGSW